MIKVAKSETADTRTCDFAKVDKATLEASSVSHIRDVYMGLRHFQELLEGRAKLHDWDKLKNLDSFHADFVNGFKTTTWWDNHRRLTRHHLNFADGVRGDVNLVDLIEHVTDCVMAGMARAGSVYDIELSDELLQQALKNTVEQLKAEVEISPE